MKIVLLIIGFLFAAPCIAQFTESGRVEFDFENNELGKSVAIGDHGLVVIGPKEKMKEKVWVGHWLNKSLATDHSFEITLPEGMEIDQTAASVDEKEVAFLFRKRSKLHLVVYQLESKKSIAAPAKIEASDSITFSQYHSGKFYFSVNRYDSRSYVLDVKTAKQQPVILPQNGNKTINVNYQDFDPNAGLLCLVTQSAGLLQNALKQQFLINFYDANGNKKGQPIVIKNQEGYAQLTANILMTGKADYFVSGLYSMDGAYIPNGIYIAIFKNNRQEKIVYHSFTEFKDYFSHLTPLEKKLAEKRISDAKKKGEIAHLRSFMATHTLIQKENKLLFVGEVFEKTTRSAQVTEYRGGKSETVWKDVFDGYQYTHAQVLVFDMDAKLLAENSFPMFLMNKPKGVVKNLSLEFNQGALRMIYDDGEWLKGAVVTADNQLKELQSAKIRGLDTDEKVKKVWNWEQINSSFWYPGHFVVYGAQRVKGGEKSKNRNIYGITVLQMVAG